MEIQFNIWNLRINGMESSSALNIGTNLLIGFDSSTKSTQGNGQLNGDRALQPSLVSQVDDRDLIDTPVWEVGPWGAWQA